MSVSLRQVTVRVTSSHHLQTLAGHGDEDLPILAHIAVHGIFAVVGDIFLHQILIEVLEVHEVVDLMEDMYAARGAPLAGFGDGRHLVVDHAVGARYWESGLLEEAGGLHLVEHAGGGVEIRHGHEHSFDLLAAQRGDLYGGVDEGEDYLHIVFFDNAGDVVDNSGVGEAQAADHFPFDGNGHMRVEFIGNHLHIEAESLAALLQEARHGHTPRASQHKYGSFHNC